MELLVPERDDPFYGYPAFSDSPHSDDTWSWDPDTLMLKVNTSFYVK